MKYFDPSYLRKIIDGLEIGIINDTNLNTIPLGLIDFFEELFSRNQDTKFRQDTLMKFTYLGIINEAKSIQSLSELTNYTPREWSIFINNYSKYFNAENLSQYSLYHQRFSTFIVQKSNQKLILDTVRNLIHNLGAYSDKNWIKTNVGRFLILDSQSSLLLKHLNNELAECDNDWWIRDFNNLLDHVCIALTEDIDFTLIAELLRPSYDTRLIQKGSYVLIKFVNSIDWSKLTMYFEATRFQYYLAGKMAQNPKYWPTDWENMLSNLNHPMNYTMSYVLKYSAFYNENQDLKLIQEKYFYHQSPYQRMILLEIFGFRLFKNGPQEWDNDIFDMNHNWPYFRLEYIKWRAAYDMYVRNYYKNTFDLIKMNSSSNICFILDNYWDLFINLQFLENNLTQIVDSNYSITISELLLKHPVWEVGEIGQNVILQNLRIKEKRCDAMKWLIDSSSIGLTGYAGILIPSKKYFESASDFFDVCKDYVLHAQSIERGEFLSEVNQYLEYNADVEFELYLWSDLLKIIVEKSDDIWETQELIRLFNHLLLRYPQYSNIIESLVHQHFLLSKFRDPINYDYNDFWKEANLIMGYS